jgi:hypothetical protein
MKKMIFLKVKNSYNKKLVTWLDLNLQVALIYKIIEKRAKNVVANKRVFSKSIFCNFLTKFYILI